MSLSETTTSTGHSLSEASWLDAHFESARVEYEESVRWIGIQPGWKVLDAGCGNGGFLPLLGELVGSTGELHAVDLAPEHIEHIRSQKANGALPKLDSVQASSLLKLPFRDHEFEAIWCANVFQYLSEAECTQAISEFKRVLIPGGLLGVKDFDDTQFQMLPIDPGMLGRHLPHRRLDEKSRNVMGWGCGASIPGILRGLGLEGIRRKSWLVERWSPLSPASIAFASTVLEIWAEFAAKYALPEEDVKAWAALARDRDRLLSDPDFCLREGFVVATGRTPK